VTAEIIALPTAAAPVCSFRYGDLVVVDGDGTYPMKFVGLVNPSSGEPLAKLSLGDRGVTFVRIGRVTLRDEGNDPSHR
jgi:hypothetical protein